MADGWRILAAAIGIQLAALQNDTVRVFPLSEPGDPVRLSDATFDVTDPARPAIVVHVQNTTSQPLTTRHVWLSTARFFTRDEMLNNGDRVAYNCGKMARADSDERTRAFQPGMAVKVKVLVAPNCQLDHEHEHFFVIVQRVDDTDTRYSTYLWKREAGDFARLLQAAMPHH